MIDSREIKNILPHRFPFLLVDRVIELEPEVRAVGIKNVTINEQFFQGHFPDFPIMPGVLIVEAMAQVEHPARCSSATYWPSDPEQKATPSILWLLIRLNSGNLLFPVIRFDLM